MNDFLPHISYPGISYAQTLEFCFTYIDCPKGDSLYFLKEGLKNGLLFEDILHEDDRGYFFDQIKKAHPDKPCVLNYKLRPTGDQKIIYITDYRTPIYLNGKISHYEGVLMDNTRCRIAEKRLQHASQREHVATLTSGLIHDFSNVMAGIYSLSELYCDSMQSDDPKLEGMLQIKKNSQEARKLIRRIIDLNREKIGKKSYFDVNKLVKEQVDLIRVVLPKNLSINLNVSKQEIPVYVDDVLFRQVLLNMALNAKDAQNDNGEITIFITTKEEGEVLFKDIDENPVFAFKKGVCISFSDNGSGISKENVKKIFSPFFTTKESMKGSGLGLYNAYQFFEEHGGCLGVESELGVGTTFYMYLPEASFNENQDNDIEYMSHKIAIYSLNNAQHFEITSLLREHNWGIMTFDDLSHMRQYIEDTKYVPEAFYVMDFGGDPQLPEIIEYMESTFPTVKRAIQVFGQNPDAVSEGIKKRIDCLLDGSSPPKEVFLTLNQLMS